MKNSSSYISKQYAPYLEKMPDSSLKSYVSGRVIEQIQWYDKKSAHCQKLFKRMAFASIILNACIPIAVLASDYCALLKFVVIGLSSAAGAINAISTLYQYKELWVEYRTNCELLKSILHRFFLHAGEFHNASDEQEMLDTLVISCEEYLTKEFQTWSVVVKGDQRVSNDSH